MGKEVGPLKGRARRPRAHRRANPENFMVLTVGE